MPEIVSSSQAPEEGLRRFLLEAFGASRAAYLSRHGSWLYRRPESCRVLIENGRVVAYSAFIPIRCAVDGSAVEARWWVDLYVGKEHRGKGYERLMDQEVRDDTALTLGFPNRLAAVIHRKHGWAVRDDLRVMLLPLELSKIEAARRQRGARRAVLRVGTRLLQPLSSAQRWWLSTRGTKLARRVEAPQPQALAAVYDRYRDNRVITTVRDIDYLRWRYFENPDHGELRFYLAGPPARPCLALVARVVEIDGERSCRVLDVFGDLGDSLAFRAALLLAIRDAIQEGAHQVTALASHPLVRGTMKRCGFWVSRRARFCVWSRQVDMIERFESQLQHWVLADSDNDAVPEDRLTPRAV